MKEIAPVSDKIKTIVKAHLLSIPLSDPWPKNVEIAQSTSYSEATISRLMRDPDFLDELLDEIRSTYSLLRIKADKKLAQKIDEGDVRAIELFYKRHDNLVEKRAILIAKKEEKTIRHKIEGASNEELAKMLLKMIEEKGINKKD